MDDPGKLSICIDGSRMESGRMRASVIWYDPEWKTLKIYLGIKKEVFDTELYTIGKALLVALQAGQTKDRFSRQQTEPP